MSCLNHWESKDRTLRSFELKGGEMLKEKIVHTLEQKNATILSFPERGPWGDSSYRGNCSGWIQAMMMWRYDVQYFTELFSGGGSGYDVAKDMGVAYAGADLNPNPVREGIICTDALADDVPEQFYGADFLFMHPPYSALINIPYAGSMYDDPDGSLSKRDLGQMQWPEFIKALNKIICKYYASIDSGGRMGVLVGDIRRQGRFYSMLADMARPGELEQIYIKTQHNCVSNGRRYSGNRFTPIAHEYLVVLKKPAPYMADFVLPKLYRNDLRDNVNTVTWKQVVFAALKKLGGKGSLEDIYAEVEGHKKTETNKDWKAKIRQVMQLSELFSSPKRGVWQIA